MSWRHHGLYFFLAVYPAVLVGSRASTSGSSSITEAVRRGSSSIAGVGWPRRVFALADVVTAPSEFLAGVIRHRFQVPVSIVPNMLDSSLFEYRQRTALRPRLLVTRHLEKIYDIESCAEGIPSGTGASSGCVALDRGRRQRTGTSASPRRRVALASRALLRRCRPSRAAGHLRPVRHLRERVACRQFSRCARRSVCRRARAGQRRALAAFRSSTRTGGTPFS